MRGCRGAGLGALGVRLRQDAPPPRSRDPAMARTPTLNNEKLYDYTLATWLRDSDLKRRLREETAKLTAGGMQIGPDQGQLMALLVARHRRQAHRRDRHLHRLLGAVHGGSPARGRPAGRLRRQPGMDRRSPAATGRKPASPSKIDLRLGAGHRHALPADRRRRRPASSTSPSSTPTRPITSATTRPACCWCARAG